MNFKFWHFAVALGLSVLISASAQVTYNTEEALVAQCKSRWPDHETTIDSVGSTCLVNINGVFVPEKNVIYSPN